VQALDSLDLFGFEMKVEDTEIGPHVVGISGAGEGHDPDIESEPEDNLADGPAVAFGDLGQLGPG
jgi:hypothetical protein